jgi:hypothetical protein
MVYSWKILFIGLFTSMIFLLGGCAHTQQSVTDTYIQHSANVVISPRLNDMNADIQRIGIAPFSFSRPQKEQHARLSIVRPSNAGEIVSDIIADVPLMVGYDVIDRRQLKILLEEKNLTVSDLLNPGTGAKMGKTLGIQAVIVGTVTEFDNWNDGLSWGNHISFNARFLRLDTGEVLWTTTAAKAGQQDYNVLLHEICKEIAENLKKQNAIRKIK